MSEEYFHIGPIIEICGAPNFNFYEFEEKYNLIEETLHCLNNEHITKLGDGNFILIENMPRPVGAPSSIEFIHGGSYREITSDKIESSLKWFNEYFKDDIEALKEELGEGSVKVYFGAVMYFN